MCQEFDNPRGPYPRSAPNRPGQRQQSRRRSVYLWQGLQANPRARTLLELPPPAGLVSFELSGEDPQRVVKRLGEQGIWLRSLDDPHCLRACTHMTSTEAEIDQLLEALQTV